MFQPRLRISKSLQVLKVQEGSLAANRLDPGDIVHKVNGEIVVNRKEFYRMMNDIAKDPDCQAVCLEFVSHLMHPSDDEGRECYLHIVQGITVWTSA